MQFNLGTGKFDVSAELSDNLRGLAGLCHAARRPVSSATETAPNRPGHGKPARWADTLTARTVAITSQHTHRITMLYVRKEYNAICQLHLNKKEKFAKGDSATAYLGAWLFGLLACPHVQVRHFQICPGGDTAGDLFTQHMALLPQQRGRGERRPTGCSSPHL